MTALNKKLRSQLRLHHALFVVLLLVLVAMLGYFALETRVQWDASQNGRNSLSQTSHEILQNLNGPVEITAYATEKDANLGNLRQIMSEFVALYQRTKPDITLTFVNPVENPQLAKNAGVSVNGEMVIVFKGRQEHLTVINEQALTNVLMRLAREEATQILALTGHGERKLDGTANYDLGEFGKQLLVNGISSQTVNLATESDIPNNTRLLIIASPQVDLMPGEVDKLLVYIKRGGNLLWLVDQESLRELLPLAEELQLTLLSGVVVDPQAQQLNAPITFALGAEYGQHAITKHFDYITVFPFARQVVINHESEEWRGVSLVDVAPEGWVETGDLEGEVTFDQLYDVAGPISIAAALSRVVEDEEQRIVVVGSGHFIANAYLGNGGNLDFGINVINWLVGDDNLISIQPRATRDSQLALSETELTVMVAGFLIALPLILLLSGVFIWWQRRKR